MRGTIILVALIWAAPAQAREDKSWWEMTVEDERYTKRYFLNRGCPVSIKVGGQEIELFAYDYEQPGEPLEQHVVITRTGAGLVLQSEPKERFPLMLDQSPPLDGPAAKCWPDALTLPPETAAFFRGPYVAP
ncbi:MAG TPA: hypothetical protein VGB99_18335 [Acidobacteriota bacterium]|jgi:hypothetical protein